MTGVIQSGAGQHAIVAETLTHEGSQFAIAETHIQERHIRNPLYLRNKAGFREGINQKEAVSY